MSARTHSMVNPAVLATCAALGTIALTGCGGSGSAGGSASAGAQDTSHSQTASVPGDRSATPHIVKAKARTSHGAKTPARSNPDIGGTKAQSTPPTRGSHTDAGASAGAGTAHRSDRVVKSGGTQKARLVAVANDDTTATSSHAVNPCTLVPLAQAQGLTGGGISARFEAPQGPTCIYEQGKTKSEITVAVESMTASQLTNHLGQREKLTVAGRTAYCGKLGHQLLVVPLANGQLLSVSAPCGVAQKFAEVALGRLSA